jgi:hypothetical protein
MKHLTTVANVMKGRMTQDETYNKHNLDMPPTMLLPSVAALPAEFLKHVKKFQACGTATYQKCVALELEHMFLSLMCNKILHIIGHTTT